MKKFNKIFLTLAAVLSLASCQEDLGLDVYENHLYMTSSERTKLLYVSTEYNYTEVINASIAKPAEEDVSPCAWLSRRLAMAQCDQTQITPQGRAFLREVARGCFAPGGADEKTMLDLRARAAILQRRQDTGAFAAAAGLAAAKTKEV